MGQPKANNITSPKKRADSWEGVGVSQWLGVALAGVVSALLFVGLTKLGMDWHVFDFRFNPYALFSLAAVASNLVLLVLIGRVKEKTHDMVWLSLYITCLLMWAIVEFFTRISANTETFLFWWPISTLPSFFMPVMLFMFVLSYTKPKQGRNIWTIVPLFVAAMLMVFFDLRTPLFNHYIAREVIATPWNGAVAPGIFYNMVALWIVGLTVLSIVMLVLYYRRTLEPTLKRQARLLIIATLVPVSVGIVTDALLPALGIFDVLPLAVMLTALSGALYTYAILRYRFLTFSSSVVAANILETINEAVIGVGSDLSINYVNQGAENLLGYSRGQMAKQHFSDFLSQDWSQEDLKKFLLVPMVPGHRSEFGSIDLRTAGGGILTVKLSISQVSEDGMQRGYLVVMTDISEMARAAEMVEKEVRQRTREVREAEATLVTSINSLRLGFIITNAKPEVIRLNTVAHDLFCGSHEHTAGECREVTVAKVQAVMGKSIAVAQGINECLRRQLPSEFNNVASQNRNWRVYLSPMVVDHKSIGCAVLLQDTTDEQILERSRDEFFSIASHELRTPLTSIKGNSSLILEYYKDVLKDATLKEMVTDIHESSDRLIEIVNDFLDVSRLEQGRIEFHLEQLLLPKVVEEVAYGMGALIKQKNLHLVLSHSLARLDQIPAVVADKNRLKQILFNLVGNAVKFTNKGGRITIGASVLPGFVEVTVADTGAGISAEYQALLFHKFQQASDSILTRDSSNGTGLGLYISRLLAVGMGGTLELRKSELGKGSVFALRILLATPERLKHLGDSAKVLDTKSGLMVDKESSK